MDAGTVWFSWEVQGQCGPVAVVCTSPSHSCGPFPVRHQWIGPCAAVLREKHPGHSRRSLAEPQEMNSLVYASGYMVLTGSCQVEKILV